LEVRIVAAGYVRGKPMTFKVGSFQKTVRDIVFEYLRGGIGRAKPVFGFERRMAKILSELKS